jgi:ATP-dependent helicase/nuclease subunit A
LLPSKLTVTELKTRLVDIEGRDETGDGLLPKRPPIFRLPDFLKSRRPLTGAERGVATHMVMQCIDYKKTGSIADIRAEIDRLYGAGFLDDRERDAADPVKLLRFFASEEGRSLLSADRVYREFRFSRLYPARDFFPDGSDAEILLQGVVDCCFEKDGALTVLDFKTDRVTAESIDAAAESYFPQVRAYARAMREITGLPVKKCALYFFAADALIEAE